MYAGGMLYFSSGSVMRGLRGGPACNAVALRAGACAEAVASAISETRQTRKVVFEILEWLISRECCFWHPPGCSHGAVSPCGWPRAGRLDIARRLQQR